MSLVKVTDRGTDSSQLNISSSELSDQWSRKMIGDGKTMPHCIFFLPDDPILIAECLWNILEFCIHIKHNINANAH